MKNYLTVLVLIFFHSGFAQVVVDSDEYNERKRSNTLEGIEIISSAPGSATLHHYQPGSNANRDKTLDCNCYVEPDASYIVAMPPNDDGSSDVIPIPFDFCFYGEAYNELYINNNGSISFDIGYFTYTPYIFPSAGLKMIAPFWGDVDTRAIGQVVYKITPTAIYINWVDVGYYDTYSDKVNSFQLILTDGTDPIVTDGTDPIVTDGNIAFCYKEMQWTTGDASSGVNGFGGAPALPAVNTGNGTDFFALAQFDHAGTDFDGPFGNTDGISWLDNRSFYFDVCYVYNTPPAPLGISACDTFALCAFGDTANIVIPFLSTEINQSLSFSFSNGSGLNITDVSDSLGNSNEMMLQIIAQPGTAGDHTMMVTATDNFIPAGVTTISFTIHIDSLNGNSPNPVISYSNTCDSVLLSVLNGPYDSYLWDDFTVGDTAVKDSAGFFGVTVNRNGCYKRVETYVQITEPGFFDLQGSFLLCTGIPNTSIFIEDSLKYASINWSLGDPQRDTMFINSLSSGTYTLTLTDTSGVCTSDTVFTINAPTSIVLEPNVVLCDSIYVFTGNTGGTGEGEWSFFNSAGIPEFGDTLDLNTTVNLSDANGTYQLIYTDKNCPYADTIVINKSLRPEFGFNSDFFHCEGETVDLFVMDSLALDSISWGLTGLPGDTLYFNSLTAGTYTVHIEDTAHICPNDTTFIISTTPPLILQADTVFCGDVLSFTYNQGGSGQGAWVLINGIDPPVFSDTSELNPTVGFVSDGTYELAYYDVVCNYGDTIQLISSSPVFFGLNADFLVNPGELEYVFVSDSTNKGSISWGLSDPALDTLFSANLAEGTYTVSITNAMGLCPGDTTFTIESQLTGLIFQLDQQNQVQLFPNPANESQQIVLDFKEQQNLQISLHDLSGKEVLHPYDGKTGIGKTSINVDLSQLSVGMYIYKIKLDDAVSYRKTEKL